MGRPGRFRRWRSGGWLCGYNGYIGRTLFWRTETVPTNLEESAAIRFDKHRIVISDKGALEALAGVVET